LSFYHNSYIKSESAAQIFVVDAKAQNKLNMEDTPGEPVNEWHMATAGEMAWRWRGGGG